MFRSASTHERPALKSRSLCAVGMLLLAGVMASQSVSAAGAQPETITGPTFRVLDNPGDANFNQLLGINDGGVIVGYFGDGTVIANNGYVLVPQNHYAVENFTHLPAGDSAVQTQAIGINSRALPDIVGFYTDAMTGFTHGWVDSNGVQTVVDDPAGTPPNVVATNQNLLGINDLRQAAGFWLDNQGHEHGFVVNIHPLGSFYTEISPRLFPGAVATQASDITDNDNVCGFWTDAKGNDHGFTGQLGTLYRTFNVQIRGLQIISTMPFGCDNNGDIVGAFTDSRGGVHGFTYRNGTFTRYDAPRSSQSPAFNVSGTIINGIDDEGDFVGFFSDGTHVNGFVKLASQLAK